jgi:hypothetical protein
MCGGQSGTGTGLLRELGCRCQYHPTSSPYLVIFHLEMEERLTKSDTSRRQVSSLSSLPPPPQQQQQEILNYLYCYFQIMMIIMNNKSSNWKGTF